jgi:hypothetical protein
MLDHTRAEALRRAYGSTAEGLRALVAAAVSETKRLIDAVSSHSCIGLQEAAAALGIDRHGARKLLEALGYNRVAFGRKVYYCRGEASFEVGGIRMTPESVDSAIKRLVQGCRSRTCSVRIASVLEALGLSRSDAVAATVVEGLAAEMGYKIERWGRRVYIVVERQ